MISSFIYINSKKLTEVTALVLRHPGIPVSVALSSRYQESLILLCLGLKAKGEGFLTLFVSAVLWGVI